MEAQPASTVPLHQGHHRATAWAPVLGHRLSKFSLQLSIWPCDVTRIRLTERVVATLPTQPQDEEDLDLARL